MFHGLGHISVIKGTIIGEADDAIKDNSTKEVHGSTLVAETRRSGAQCLI